MNKTCIISGRYTSTDFESPTNHKMYADKFGYDYIHCNWPTKAQNVYLNKIYYILSYIEKYEYIIWIDDDAFFWDFSKDIMLFKPIGSDLISFCKSPDYKELKTELSSGQFITKCNSTTKLFFENILSTKLSIVKAWWKDEYGYFSNGDQDIMIYLLYNNPEKFPFKKYNYKKFNSRFENLYQTEIHKPLILHFTGRPEIKKNNYNKVQEKYLLNPALVKKEFTEDYHLRFKRRKSKLSRIFKIIFKEKC
ncbi:hypothetical protein [Wenyingzhuangia sp. IMCC45574]